MPTSLEDWDVVSSSSESTKTNSITVKRADELHEINKLEFVWEFSQLSCPGQTRTRVA